MDEFNDGYGSSFRRSAVVVCWSARGIPLDNGLVRGVGLQWVERGVGEWRLNRMPLVGKERRGDE